MIKNTRYTFDYFQPEDYRFSLDSVFLAQVVAKYLVESKKELNRLKFLDLCSGCGVIGLELSIHLPDIKEIDFLEVQEIYFEYFKKNLNAIHPNFKELSFHFIHQNYEDMISENFKNKYDYILSNPPYFFKGEGLLSPNDFKNRCRFFLDSNFASLINSIIHSLKPTGLAFILIRPGDHHGRNLLNEINSLLTNKGTASIFDNIRGTNVIQIAKNEL